MGVEAGCTAADHHVIDSTDSIPSTRTNPEQVRQETGSAAIKSRILNVKGASETIGKPQSVFDLRGRKGLDEKASGVFINQIRKEK